MFLSIKPLIQQELPDSTNTGITDFESKTEFSGGDMFVQDQGEITTGMSNMNIVREEPEFLKKWKLEQEERLKKKDEDEEIMKEKLREQARQELEDW